MKTNIDKLKELFGEPLYKKEKYSKKQRLIGLFMLIAATISLTIIGFLIFFSVNHKIWETLLLFIALIIFFIITIILSHYEEKEYQRVTNKSIEYYKRKNPKRIYIEVCAIIFSIVVPILFFTSEHIMLNISTLYSINIGVFSLVPIIYVFILPQIKEITNSAKFELKDTISNISKRKKQANIKYLKKKQCTLYNLINTTNSINFELIINIILFTISIIMFLSDEKFNNIIQIFPVISIFYSLFEIYMLIYLLLKINSYNKNEIENKMKKQIEKINESNQQKKSKENLKLYNKSGSLVGYDTRKNYFKKPKMNYYKVAYAIIKNNKNKYLIYQQIINYEKQKFCWSPLITYEELKDENIKQTIIKESKRKLGITLDKNSLDKLHTFIDNDGQKIIDVYSINTKLKSLDIDYDIDEIIDAKFVTKSRFKKALIKTCNLNEKSIDVVLDKI